MAKCPICNGRDFRDYHGRKNARCAGCGSKERARIMALVLDRLAPEPNGLRVYHFAPEEAIADILLRKYKDAYTPADFAPEVYSWCKVPVVKVDLSQAASYLPKHTAQVLIHSHVLEHIPAPIDKVISEMNQAVSPGGFHIFQVPIHPGWYREDMDPEMPNEEREKRFYQHDHLRVFGANDFSDRCLRLFQEFERIDLSKIISSSELVEAEVRASAIMKPTGHTPFVFRKKAS